MDYRQCSDREILRCIVGARAAARLYQGSLHALFFGPDDGSAARGKLSAARELVRRMLAEEMTHSCALTAPNAVRDYLRLLFRGRGYESFVTIFLDSQNRVIVSEEMFRGTLAQTSVYPREVVKRALEHN